MTQKEVGSSLIDIGSCNLHVVHNSFKAGFTAIKKDWKIEDFMNDIFYWFKKYPSRKEDFVKLENNLSIVSKDLKRLVNSRWLSMGPVCERVLKQLPVLQEYFLKSIGKEKQYTDLDRYKRIAVKLQNLEETKIQLQLILDVARRFEQFIPFFQ